MVLVCGVPQLFVPTGNFELFASGEGKCAGEMDGVVCTKRMGASALGCLRQQLFVNGMDV